MFNLKKLLFLVLTVLFLGGITASPAFADDSAPPADDSAVSDPAPPEETEPIETILPDLPEGNAVVIVDEAGNPVALGTQQAEEILMTGDPMWCPVGVTPGGAGCSPSFTIFYDNGMTLGLIPWLMANQPAKDGVIWVASSYNSADEIAGTTVIQLNGAALGAMANYKLTIKGGWSGVTGSTATDPLAPTTFTGDALHIINWNNDITLSDIVITGSSNLNALLVQTTKNVILTRVKSEGNSNNGANIDNTASGSGTGSVTITASQFKNNTGGNGLTVNSNGAIILKDVTAQANANHGAILDNKASATAAPVTLSGDLQFNNNGNSGLAVDSLGKITITDLNANYNWAWGAMLSNAYGSSTAGISLSGTNIASGNGSGIYILSYGPVTLNNMIANANAGTGAYVQNNAGALPAPVTLTGSSQFKYNGGYGLRIISSGLVTASNLTANGNQDGAWIDNGSGVADVKITGTNLFNDNLGGGLMITSKGAIITNNLTASENGAGGVYGVGVFLQNSTSPVAKSVTLTGVNLFNGNFESGLYILASGAITTNTLTANENLGYGVLLDNQSLGVTSPQNVTLNGVNTFNDNFVNGLAISTYGGVKTNSITANDTVSDAGAIITSASSLNMTGVNTFNNNGYTGLYVYISGLIKINSAVALNNADAGLYLNNTTAAAPAAVTLTGNNNVSENSGIGMAIASYGAVLINNLTANLNDLEGVAINNTYAPSNPVKFTGYLNLIKNGQTGAFILTYGSVGMNAVNASNNGGSGVYVGGSLGSILNSFTLTGNNAFNNNDESGLQVEVKGAITVNNVTANSNGIGSMNVQYGALLENNFTGSASGITLTGTNTFNGNKDGGLLVMSNGVITTNNITASNNQNASGAKLDNLGAASPIKVVINGVNTFNYNGNMGLEVYSNGAITANSLSASNNTNTGVRLDNDGAGAAGGVTLTGTNVFNKNTNSNGLYITSLGTVNVKNITANLNNLNGAYLDNSSAPTPQNVTISGTNVFNDNASNGLHVATNGSISANSITANANNGDGVYLDNDGMTSSGNILLTGTSTFNGNLYHGLDIWTNGNVTLSNVTANGNGTSAVIGHGVSSITSQQKSFTLLGFNTFNNNFANGLYVQAGNTVALNNIAAKGNLWGGAIISNTNGGAVANVSLNGTNTFNQNNGTGLLITTNGALSITKISADGNASRGVQVSAGSTVTITCGSFTNNISNAAAITALGLVKYIGVFAYGNSLDTLTNMGAGGFSITRKCPLP